jgi:hypothetical protein
MSMFVMVAVIPEKDTGMNLVIFEPRYRLMIRRAMESSRRFGMMAPESDSATEVELARVDPLPDGRFHITIVPTGRRARVVSSRVDESGYLIGHVRDVTDASDDVAAAYMRRAESMIEHGTVRHPGRDLQVLRVREEASDGEEAGDAAARWFAEHVCELDAQIAFAVTSPRTGFWTLRKPKYVDVRIFEQDIFYIAGVRGAQYDPATDDREHLKGLPEFQEGGSGKIPIADVSLEVFMHEFHSSVKRAIKHSEEDLSRFHDRFREFTARGLANKKVLEEAIEPRKWDDPDAVSWSLTCAEEFSWKMCNAVAGLDLVIHQREFSRSRAWSSSFCAVAVGSQSVRERLVLCRALLMQLEHLAMTSLAASIDAMSGDEDEDEDEDEEEEEDEDEDEDEDEEEDEEEEEEEMEFG